MGVVVGGSGKAPDVAVAGGVIRVEVGRLVAPGGGVTVVAVGSGPGRSALRQAVITARQASSPARKMKFLRCEFLAATGLAEICITAGG
jgi:hypothetical protein